METKTCSNDFRSRIIFNDGEKLDENLLCMICQELVLDPLECEECQHLFCQQCIKEWVNKSNLCPIKCPSSPPKLRNPHRFVKNALGALRFKCENAHHGCDSINCMEQIQAHLKVCNYQQIHCKNKGCNYVGPRQGMNQHYNLCEHEEIGCGKCGFNLMRSSVDIHDCIKELTKRVKQLEIENSDSKQSLSQSLMRIQQLEKSQSEILEQISIIQQQQAVKLKCPSNHILNWTQGSYGPCVGCKKSNQVLRYCCQTCKVGYCQICKTPQIKNMLCPLGHKIEKLQIVPKSLICDLCACIPFEKKLEDFRDPQCDFDICSACFDKMK